MCGSSGGEYTTVYSGIPVFLYSMIGFHKWQIMGTR